MHTLSAPCLYQRNGGVVHPGQLCESGTSRLGAAERKAAKMRSVMCGAGSMSDQAARIMRHTAAVSAAAPG